jgi:hypothetical protein
MNDFTVVQGQPVLAIPWKALLLERIALLEGELAEEKKLFIRMESAWRGELESRYRDEPSILNSHPSLLASLNGKLKAAEEENAALKEQVQERGRRMEAMFSCWLVSRVTRTLRACSSFRFTPGTAALSLDVPVRTLLRK